MNENIIFLRSPLVTRFLEKLNSDSNDKNYKIIIEVLIWIPNIALTKKITVKNSYDYEINIQLAPTTRVFTINDFSYRSLTFDSGEIIDFNQSTLLPKFEVFIPLDYNNSPKGINTTPQRGTKVILGYGDN